MSLDEKSNQKFGGMCKSVKSKMSTMSDADKKSNYDKNYHYPSGKETRPQEHGNNGPTDQHTTTEGIKYFKPSNG